MKKLVTIFLAFAIVSLLAACTDGGNVSDRTDGVISESTTAAEPGTHSETENTSTMPSGSSNMTTTGDSNNGTPGTSGGLDAKDDSAITTATERPTDSARTARPQTTTPNRY